MTIIFSDLDGTLLGKHDYSWEAARPALERAAASGWPLVLVSSKTRAEMEHWRTQLGNAHPFIVENGGAAFIPSGYFPRVDGAVERGPYQVLEWGTPYADLCDALRRVEAACGCKLTGFHELTAAQIAAITELPPPQAEMARQREYDEPFLAAGDCDEDRIGAAAAALGLRRTRGGRLAHLHGANDKAVAVRALMKLYRREHPHARTAGLGDAPNDLPFLRIVEIPVIIRSRDSEAMRRELPAAIVTDEPGPAGWNQAVAELLASQS